MQEKIQDQVYDLVKPVIEEMDLELVAVEYVKEGASWYLRIYIDKENGVDLDDCERVSRVLSDLLDKHDPIPQAYFLEVSSPGIERLLQRDADFVRFRGELVNVQLFSPLAGRKKLQGTLGEVNGETLQLILQDQSTLDIPRDKIAQVRLAWVE